MDNGIINDPIEVLGRKIFPSGAQLTKLKLGGQVAYVRENVQDGAQILELLAPERFWDGIARVIALEDHLKRSVRKNDDDFTSEWAEAELAKA